MYQISRRDKRQRTGFEYAPDAHAPSLLNKSQYVMMNGKISSRSQYMGLNFKDDSRDTTYVNIAEAGYAFDAVSRSDVVSTAPVNVAAAGRAVINMRQLLTFLSMLFEVDPTLKDLLERYRARFKQQYEVLEPMATVDANPQVTPKTGSMAMAATTTQTGSMPVAESSGQSLGNIAGNITRKYLEIRTISKAYLTAIQYELASGAISQKQAQQDEEELYKALDNIQYYMDSDILVADKLKHLDFLKNALIKDLEARKTAFAGRSRVIPPEPSPSTVTPEATLPPVTPGPSAVTSDPATTTVSEVIGPGLGEQKNLRSQLTRTLNRMKTKGTTRDLLDKATKIKAQMDAKGYTPTDRLRLDDSANPQDSEYSEYTTSRVEQAPQLVHNMLQESFSAVLQNDQPSVYKPYRQELGWTT